MQSKLFWLRDVCSFWSHHFMRVNLHFEFVQKLNLSLEPNYYEKNIDRSMFIIHHWKSMMTSCSIIFFPHPKTRNTRNKRRRVFFKFSVAVHYCFQWFMKKVESRACHFTILVEAPKRLVKSWTALLQTKLIYLRNYIVSLVLNSCWNNLRTSIFLKKVVHIETLPIIYL